MFPFVFEAPGIVLPLATTLLQARRGRLCDSRHFGQS